MLATFLITSGICGGTGGGLVVHAEIPQTYAHELRPLFSYAFAPTPGKFVRLRSDEALFESYFYLYSLVMLLPQLSVLIYHRFLSFPWPHLLQLVLLRCD